MVGQKHHRPRMDFPLGALYAHVFLWLNSSNSIRSFWQFQNLNHNLSFSLDLGP
uniref:Uncharacterized protein n=1 Tax=Helianthus annuus TaxID=4232 RepID=A0A251U431_HELAN